MQVLCRECKEGERGALALKCLNAIIRAGRGDVQDPCIVEALRGEMSEAQRDQILQNAEILKK